MNTLKNFQLLICVIAVAGVPGINAGIPSAHVIHHALAGHNEVHANVVGAVGHHDAFHGAHTGGVIAHRVGVHGRHGLVHHSPIAVVPHGHVHSSLQAVAHHVTDQHGIGIHGAGHGGHIQAHGHHGVIFSPVVLHGHNSAAHHGALAHHSHGIAAHHGGSHHTTISALNHHYLRTAAIAAHHHAPTQHAVAHAPVHHGVGYHG